VWREELLEGGEGPVQDDGPVAGAGVEGGFGVVDCDGEAGLGELLVGLWIVGDMKDNERNVRNLLKTVGGQKACESRADDTHSGALGLTGVGHGEK